MLLKNDETGVYGTMGLSKFYCEPVEIALRQEIQEGPVQILTTIQGNAPQSYEAVIEKINLSDQSMTKNMIIRITDPDLIAATGGIVQGMSGSPILQNGKLIGAVTHVFVNDPPRLRDFRGKYAFYHERDEPNSAEKRILGEVVSEKAKIFQKMEK